MNKKELQMAISMSKLYHAFDAQLSVAMLNLLHIYDLSPGTAKPAIEERIKLLTRVQDFKKEEQGEGNE